MDPTETPSPPPAQVRAVECAAELLVAPNALLHLSMDEARVVVGYMTPRYIPAQTTFIREGDAQDEGFMALLLEQCRAGGSTLVTNVSRQSDQVVARTTDAGSTSPCALN